MRVFALIRLFFRFLSAVPSLGGLLPPPLSVSSSWADFGHLRPACINPFGLFLSFVSSPHAPYLAVSNASSSPTYVILMLGWMGTGEGAAGLVGAFLFVCWCFFKGSFLSDALFSIDKRLWLSSRAVYGCRRVLVLSLSLVKESQREGDRETEVEKRSLQPSSARLKIGCSGVFCYVNTNVCVITTAMRLRVRWDPDGLRVKLQPSGSALWWYGGLKRLVAFLPFFPN